MTTPVAAASAKDRVLIFDTTLRDGEQCPGTTMTLEEKIEVADLLDAFDKETPPLLETLRETAATNDAPAFKQAAHALNGISRGVGARHMAATCSELEDLPGTGDLHDAQSLLARLTREWEQARGLLAAKLRTP